MLCDEIIRTDCEMMGKYRKKTELSIDWAIRKNISLKDKLPSIINIADLNWEGTLHLGLSSRIRDRSIHYVFSNSSNEVQRVNWSPQSLWSWDALRRAPKSAELSAARSLTPVARSLIRLKNF